MMPDGFDVLTALGQGQRGAFQPPAGTPSAPGVAPEPAANPPAQFDVLGALGQGQRGAYKPPPAPPPSAGILQNLAAGANRTIFSTLGAPVDLATAGLNAGIRGIDSATGAGIPQIQHPVGGSDWLSQLWGGVTGTNPQNVQPQNEGERIAAAIGSGVASVPLMGVEGAAAARALPQAMPVARGVAQSVADASGTTLPQAANVAGVVGAGAAVGQGAEDAVPEPYKPLANLAGNLVGAGGAAGLEGAARAAGRGVANQAGMIGVGSKVNVGGVRVTRAQLNAAGNQVGSALGQEGQQALTSAANAEARARELETVLADQNAAPEAKRAAQAELEQIAPQRENLVPGSQPTTAQIAPTAAGLERAHRVATPEPFQARAQQQNAARLAAVQGLAPSDAQPGAVGEFFRQQLEALDQRGQQAVTGARQAVQGQTEALGGLPPQSAGQEIRGALEGKADTLDQHEDALWKAVDPDGKLALPLGTVQQTARDILNEINPSLGDVTDNQELQILRGAANLPDVIPFRDAQRLRSNIGYAQRALRGTPGNDQSLHRLGVLKSALNDDIAGGAEAAAQRNSGVAARLDALAREDGGQQLPGGSGGEGNEERPGGAPAGVLGQGGGAGTGNGRRRNAQGNRRLEAAQATSGGTLPADLSPFEQELYAGLAPEPPSEPIPPNWDSDANQRWEQARAATLESKEFRKGAIGRVLQAGRNGEAYRIEAADVPRQFLTANAVEPARVQQYIQKVGGEAQAVQHMRDALVGDLREKGIVQPDGTLKPDAFGTWLQRRGRTIDLFPGLRDQLQDAATAQRTLDDATAAHQQAVRDFEHSAAARFIHDDPMVAVRRAFSSGNPEQTFRQLTQQVRGNADAEAGLRGAVVDFLIEKTRSATPAGEADDFLKPAVFRNLVRQNSGALKQLFGGQGINNIDMVVADLRRQAQLSAEATPGSNTAQKLLGAQKHGLVQRTGHVSALGLLGLIGEHMGEQLHGGFLASIAGAVALPAGAELLHSMRQAGIHTVNDLVREAMLHPNVARELMARTQGGQIGPVASQRIARALQATIAAQPTQEKRQ